MKTENIGSTFESFLEEEGILEEVDRRAREAAARSAEPSLYPPVHLVNYASQPDLQFACDKTWDTPAWKAFRAGYVSPHPPGVYEAAGGRLYTFDEKLTTCPVCVALEPP